MCSCANKMKCLCPSQRRIQYLTANLATARLRRVVYNGRTHIVVPVVMLVEGVLAGSNGPLYYPADEMRVGYKQWNGIPLMDGHPERNGTPISANHDSARGRSLGVVRNTRLDRLADGRLRWKAEAWFDEEKTKIINPEILKRIEKGLPVEVSTGLFTDNEGVSGVYRGNGYSAIARKYKADHLAVLVDKVGACSLRDGCGLSVNQASNEFVLTLNKWSDEARAAAIEARRRKSGGAATEQKKPGERVRVSYDMAREYLKRKHGIDVKDKAEIRSKMQELAGKKEHHGDIREMGKARAKQKAERANRVETSTVSGGGEKKKPEAKTVVESKTIEDKKAPAEVKKKKKGGRPKYQDSGKREPVIPASWKDKYRSSDTPKKEPKKVPLVSKKDIGRYKAKDTESDKKKNTNKKVKKKATVKATRNARTLGAKDKQKRKSHGRDSSVVDMKKLESEIRSLQLQIQSGAQGMDRRDPDYQSDLAHLNGLRKQLGVLVEKYIAAKQVRNAWSEAARKAALEKRRRKGIKREYKDAHGGISIDPAKSDFQYARKFSYLNRDIQASEAGEKRGFGSGEYRNGEFIWSSQVKRELREKLKNELKKRLKVNWSESVLRLLNV